MIFNRKITFFLQTPQLTKLEGKKFQSKVVFFLLQKKRREKNISSEKGYDRK